MRTRRYISTHKLRTAMVFFFTIGLGVVFKAYSQPEVSIPAVAGCDGEELLVPLMVDEFNNIEAFTIHLIVDTTKVSFIDVEQAHESLNNGPLLSNIQDNGQAVISVVWFGNSAVNLHDTVLFQLRLKLLESPAELTFSEESELVLSDFTVEEEAVFSEGHIESWDSLVPVLSDSTILSAGQRVKLLMPRLVGLQYQWQITSADEWTDLNDDIRYQGSSSEELAINEVSEEMRNQSFRCVLTSGTCTALSNEVMLKFGPLGIAEKDGMSNPFIQFYPNPVKDYIYCRVLTGVDNAKFSIYNTSGQRMKQWNPGELKPGQVVKLAVADLNTGLFMVKLEEEEQFIASHKILINH